MDEIVCIHLTRINNLPSCKAANVEYKLYPTSFKGDMMVLRLPTTNGPDAVTGTTGVSVATVDEVCNGYLEEKKNFCGIVTSNTCPHTPVDKLVSLEGRDKCKNYEKVFLEVKI